MGLNGNLRFAATYDVIVLGFGGAGATAARFAADEGARVLLVDSAPEGHEGGNTRYSGQVVGYAHDKEHFSKYYDQLAQGFNIPADVKETVVNGVTGMKEYFENYLAEPYVFSTDDNNPMAFLGDINLATFPEFEGSETTDSLQVEKGLFNGSLWKALRKEVLERSDKIDVWYESPAKHLLKDADGKTIIGTQIKRKNVLRNIKATNGVVLAVGGFENSKQKIQDFIGENHLAVTGTTYNQGDGIDLAIEAGAQLWHMTTYNSGGMLHDLTFIPNEDGRSIFSFDVEEFCSGSILLVGDNGSRYSREDLQNREGYFDNHGAFRTPQAQITPHVIFDQKKFDELEELSDANYREQVDQAIRADPLSTLAVKIGAVPEILEGTITRFNESAKKQEDAEFHRAPESLTALDDKGPYYAIPMRTLLVNT